MRLLLLLRSLTLGVLLGYATWQGAGYLVREGHPARLLERAEALEPARPRTGLTVVLLFRPAECPQLMHIVTELNGMDAMGVRVVGALMVATHRMPDWKSLIAATQIHFPVYQIEPAQGSAATASLGYPGAPLLLVFDRDRRLLLATDDLKHGSLQPFLDHLIKRFAAQPGPGRTPV